MKQDSKMKNEEPCKGSESFKKNYTSPHLIVHGNVKKITKGGTMMLSEGMHTGSMPP